MTWRSLARTPAFTLTVVITLSLCMGANTAMWTVVKAVVVRPLPFAEPDRLLHLQVGALNTGALIPWVDVGDLADLRDQSRSFERIGYYGFAMLNLVGNGQAEALYGARISPDMLPTLGVSPILGRNFLAEEGRPGGANVILLSYGLWRNRFAADPAIVGKHIRLTGLANEDYQVIGVMPASFNFPLNIPSAVNPPSRQMAYWIPFVLDPLARKRGLAACQIVARLKAGKTLADARAELAAIAAQFARLHPETNANLNLQATPLAADTLGHARQALLILLAATGLLLLIACANIVNLLLARFVSRKRETAIRAALGAGRWRLLQHWLTESMVLAIAGGLVGLALAYFGAALLIKLAPQDIPRLADSRIDGAVFLFNFGVSLLIGFLFGVAPAWRAARSDISEALNEGGAHSTPSGGPARKALIVAEVALSMVLVVGAGLLIRSVDRLLSLDPGFRADGRLTAIIVLPNARYPDNDSKVAFFRKLLDRVRTMPGVKSAGVVNGVPLAGNAGGDFVEVEGRRSEPGRSGLFPTTYPVSEDYLATMGIAVVSGRGLTRQDAAAGFRAVVVNETAARQFWPGQDPLGKRIRFDRPGTPDAWRQVVGVVKDTRDLPLDDPPLDAIYVPLEQYTGFPQFLVVRTQQPVADFAPALRRAVATIDPDQPVFTVTSMRDLLDNSIGPRRFAMRALAAFSGLSLVLAAAGLYGLMAYSVAQRRREIGLRMALGASRWNVLRLVLRQTVVLTFAGLAIGTVAAIVFARFLPGLLYGIRASDPGTMLAACAVLLGVALLGSYPPAHQAMRVDAAQVLREQ